jgi:hypothetical protein
VVPPGTRACRRISLSARRFGDSSALPSWMTRLQSGRSPRALWPRQLTERFVIYGGAYSRAVRHRDVAFPDDVAFPHVLLPSRTPLPVLTCGDVSSSSTSCNTESPNTAAPCSSLQATARSTASLRRATVDSMTRPCCALPKNDRQRVSAETSLPDDHQTQNSVCQGAWLAVPLFCPRMGQNLTWHPASLDLEPPIRDLPIRPRGRRIDSIAARLL